MEEKGKGKKKKSQHMDRHEIFQISTPTIFGQLTILLNHSTGTRSIEKYTFSPLRLPKDKRWHPLHLDPKLPVVRAFLLAAERWTHCEGWKSQYAAWPWLPRSPSWIERYSKRSLLWSSLFLPECNRRREEAWLALVLWIYHFHQRLSEKGRRRGLVLNSAPIKITLT